MNVIVCNFFFNFFIKETNQRLQLETTKLVHACIQDSENHILHLLMFQIQLTSQGAYAEIDVDRYICSGQTKSHLQPAVVRVVDSC